MSDPPQAQAAYLKAPLGPLILTVSCPALPPCSGTWPRNPSTGSRSTPGLSGCGGPPGVPGVGEGVGVRVWVGGKAGCDLLWAYVEREPAVPVVVELRERLLPLRSLALDGQLVLAQPCSRPM